MNFIYELKTELLTNLKNELNTIITGLSTDVIPVPAIGYFYTGRFDPEMRTNLNSIFLCADVMKDTQVDGSIGYREMKQDFDLFLLMKTSTDSEKDSAILEIYAKALMIFVNNHIENTNLNGDIELFEDGLGADITRMWLHFPISMTAEVGY